MFILLIKPRWLMIFFLVSFNLHFPMRAELPKGPKSVPLGTKLEYKSLTNIIDKPSRKLQPLSNTTHSGNLSELLRDGTERQQVLAWLKARSIDEYEKIGLKDPKWDQIVIAAFEAYSEARVYPRSSPLGKKALENLDRQLGRARSLKCEDPLLNTLFFERYGGFLFKPGEKQLINGIGWYYTKLQEAKYPEIWAFQAMFGMANHWTNTLPQNKNEKANHPFFAACKHLGNALEETNMPPKLAETLVASVWGKAQQDSRFQLQFLKSVVPVLEEKWVSFAFANYFLGEAYIDLAWEKRTSQLANKVLPGQWEGFYKNLEKAESALRRGWEIDSSGVHIPSAMITVCMGMGYPREEMEKWFSRAMENDPSSQEAAARKMFYLQPKWHGSVMEMQKFGNECLVSTNYKGGVRLMLVEFHSLLSREDDLSENSPYWLNRLVWDDVSKCFEKVISESPNETQFRYSYAFYAYKCEQYKIFEDQVRTLSSGNFDFDFFGGMEAFKNMQKKAALELQK